MLLFIRARRKYGAEISTCVNPGVHYRSDWGVYLKRDEEIVLVWLYHNTYASTYWGLSKETGLPEPRLAEAFEELARIGLVMTTPRAHEITERGKAEAEKILKAARQKKIDVAHTRGVTKPLKSAQPRNALFAS